MTTPVDLDRLDALNRAATPHPWLVVWGSKLPHIKAENGAYIVEIGQKQYRNGPDAELIVALRNSYPQIAAELRAFREHVEASHNGYHESMGVDRPATHLDGLKELIGEGMALADLEMRAELRALRAEIERLRAAARQFADRVVLVEQRAEERDGACLRCWPDHASIQEQIRETSPDFVCARHEAEDWIALDAAAGGA